MGAPDSLAIFRDHYLVYVGGEGRRIESKEEFVGAFKNYRKKDTLVVKINYSFEEQIQKAMGYLDELGVRKRRVLVTVDYFTLP